MPHDRDETYAGRESYPGGIYIIISQWKLHNTKNTDTNLRAFSTFPPLRTPNNITLSNWKAFNHDISHMQLLQLRCANWCNTFLNVDYFSWSNHLLSNQMWKIYTNNSLTKVALYQLNHIIVSIFSFHHQTHVKRKQQKYSWNRSWRIKLMGIRIDKLKCHFIF